ncbi:hypothetical protein [Halocatena marina]|uniref:hypothetical protein n=1 Tax=Halocatena marina TaxID=2934937 RepID=UPI00200D0485|nr:hypothetical protein [Halocatena marina]
MIWAHIGISVVPVGTGLGALMTRRGGRRHRQFGRAYVYSIGFVVASAIVLVSLRWSPVLLIAVFSFHLAFSGNRVRSWKRDGQPTALDWAAASLTLVTGFAIAGLVLLGYLGWLVRSTLQPAFVPAILGVSVGYFPLMDL